MVKYVTFLPDMERAGYGKSRKCVKYVTLPLGQRNINTDLLEI